MSLSKLRFNLFGYSWILLVRTTNNAHTVMQIIAEVFNLFSSVCTCGVYDCVRPTYVLKKVRKKNSEATEIEATNKLD